MENNHEIMELQNVQQQLHESLDILAESIESLKKEIVQLETFNQRFQEKYGVDFFSVLQLKQIQKPITIVKKEYRVLNKQGKILMTMTEKYIKNADGSLQLLALGCT